MSERNTPTADALFPLYSAVLSKAQPKTTIEASKLTAKIRTLREVCDKDPKKRAEIEEIMEHMLVAYYAYYHRTYGVIPESPLKVPFLGKICSKDAGVITPVTDAFPVELALFLETHVDSLLSST
jgi:hypothetical protein